MMGTGDQVEILSVSLLARHRSLVANLKQLARRLGLEFGWHYLLDLTWIIDRLEDPGEKRILDAGAGVGVMQWYLAEQGAEVISVDRESRANLPRRFRLRYEVRGLRENDLSAIKTSFLPNRSPVSFYNMAREVVGGMSIGFESRIRAVNKLEKGRIIVYNQDLKNLQDIADNSVDSIVAVSALEHNPPDELADVVAELLRVLKPGCALLATLGAAKDDDWYHVPSRGWCYNEATLKSIFDLSIDSPSNFEEYDNLLTALKNCLELRENLAQFYYRSGDNGMPWGVWDPQYQPVGVCKVKSNE